MIFGVPPHTRARRATLTALALAPAVALGACSAASADDATLDVVVSFYPLQAVAERVGGTDVRVTNLTPAGGEPHDLELAPAAVRTLSSADLVLVQSGFQPAVDQAVADAAPGALVDATAVLAAGGPATVALPRDAADAEHDHDHDHHDGYEVGHDDEDGHVHGDAEAHGDEHLDTPASDAPTQDSTDLHASEHDGAHHADDGHDHDGTDPHFWLDPTRLALLAPAVADALAAADPLHASDYRDRADALVAELTDLDTAFTDGLEICEHRTIVTSHAAFGHLAARYDLDQVSVSGLDPESEPTPARLREVAATVRDLGVTTIYFESSASAKVAEVLADELGVATASLDPLETLTSSALATGADYLSTMTANLGALRTGLGCA